MTIRTILVVQGAEHRAVCRGLRQVGATPQVIPLPIGQLAAQKFLQAQLQQGVIADGSQVLVLGLCGSLRPAYAIGDSLLYAQVLSFEPEGIKIDCCNTQLTTSLQQKLGLQLVQAWSSDRFIQSVQTKQHLSQVHHADVVDMEGAAIFTAFAQTKVAIAMLRVVSDDYNHELPDVSAAISPTGQLQPSVLGWTLLCQPIGAFRLIRGINAGLSVLEEVTANLFRAETLS